MRTMHYVIILLLASYIITTHTKQAVDYNGNPLSKSGTITITPQTSSAILASYTQAINLAGLLDNTFGNYGIVNTIGGGAGVGYAYAAALQPDGKILVGGETSSVAGGYCEIIRYNSDGSIDQSFNNGTLLVGPLGYIASLLVQPDNKIIAMGGTNVAGVGTFQLIRYNSNGSIDPTFNNGIPLIGPANYGEAALLHPDGRIIAIGFSDTTFIVTRYNSDGSPDHTFNGGSPLIGPAGKAYAGLLQPDGKIIAAGSTNTPHFQLVRYNSDGSTDYTFHNGNPVTGPTGIIFATALQPDGKIIAAGTNFTGPQFQLIRYNSDGSLDATFNNGNPIVGPSGVARTVLLQPDNKIIAVGSTTLDDTGIFQLARYNSDGSVDTTFGPLGTHIVTTPHTITAYRALLQPDNKIIAVGCSTGNDFTLVRYINPFTLASFTASYGNVGML